VLFRSIRADYADCPQVVEILDFIEADSERALSSPNRQSKS
jgi:UDP-N-acetylglucosamine acyltransferase